MITDILVCVLQIATVKSPVGLETFPKTVLRKYWSPGEEFSIDGRASNVTEIWALRILKTLKLNDMGTDTWRGKYCSRQNV